MRWLSRILLAGAALLAGPAMAPADEVAQLSFNQHIRPILAANCFECHGFDHEQRQAELRLDVAEGALADRDGGRAVVPGEPQASLVWERISTDDAGLMMPPPETKKTLTAAEKSLIRQWIEQGAVYQQHWAFAPPQRPAEPAVRESSWPRNAIDRFILARLEAEGLTPRPEADRATLIRRVAFALTGLPPTVAQVDAFLSDPSPTAYEDMVDRFLASDRFGEEQARHWLDLARYADTHGLHLDNEREMWPYRDWVVKAFNENLPFDQFTTWQLAGDLLPEPTLEQQVATGFNRCNVTTSEGGSIGEEWTYRYAVDRTSTMVQVWMGLTAGCAVCHDHKYDPLTSREFYAMYAFFYSAADPAMDGNVRDTQPFIKVPDAAQHAALDAARGRQRDAEEALDEALASVSYQDPAAAEAGEPRPVLDTLIDEDFQRGTRVRNTSRNATQWVLDPAFGAASGRRAIELAYGAQYDVTVELALIPVVVPQEGELSLRLRIDPFYVPGAFAVQLDDGKARRAIWGDAAQLSGGNQTPMGPLPPAGEWVELRVSCEQLGMQPGSRIKSLVLLQNGGRVWVDDVRLGGKTVAAEDPRSSFQAWWKASQGGNPGGIEGEAYRLLVGGPKEGVTDEERQSLLQFYLRHVQRITESAVAEQRQACLAAELDVVALQEAIPGTLVFRELEQKRDAFVMLRGQYDKPGEKVEPGVPQVLPPLPRDDEATPDRLDLARWLLSPEHPLTARVAANRIWQQLFGTGLVATSDDFGTRGELPSHPDLLDWLAVEYRANGWDTKQLIKLLVTSATFRQDSTVTPQLLERDPDNRLLARGPRLRLSAEQLRDNALFVSGLINLEMGGRGVMPYQPPNIWEPVGYENSNTRFYLQDHGPDLYRRSLYCFLKRTAPPPFMTNFDGPNREQVCAQRERSNTPLQALQLMNDVQHFEAARALGERVLSEADSLDARITRLYHIVLARPPDGEELALLRRAYQQQYELFSAQPASAKQAVQVGESAARQVAPPAETAAWTMLANLVLNLDETVTRN